MTDKLKSTIKKNEKLHEGCKFNRKGKCDKCDREVKVINYKCMEV